MQHGSKSHKTNNLSQKTNIKNCCPKDQVCIYLRSTKLQDHSLMVNIATRSSVQEFWAHVVNYHIWHPNYQYRFKVQRYYCQAKVKRFFFFGRTQEDLLQFHVTFLKIRQNYLTKSRSSRWHICYYLWYMIYAQLSHSKSLKFMSPNIIIMSSISNLPSLITLLIPHFMFLIA